MESHIQSNNAVIAEKNFKLFSVFTGLFVASLVISNVIASKIFALGSLTFSAGVILFPVSYIFGDILTEVYGYQLSRKVIWTGFACQILAALTYTVAVALPPASFWLNQEAYATVFGIVPRIVVGSITAYFAGEFCNSWVLSKMKYMAKGRRGVSQAWRFVASTIVGEAVDTVIVIVIAFAGILSVSELAQVAGGIYIFKVAYEIIMTPVSTRFANWVKKIEGVDHIDYPERTNYNPFTILR